MSFDPRALADAVQSQILALKSKYPDLADDADLLADTIEGVTDFDRVMDLLAQSAIEARALSDGLATVIVTFKSRQQRYDRKAAAMRNIALALMQAAEQSNVVTPSATLTLRNPATSVVVDDVNALPQGFTETTVSPRKAEIKKALEAGEDVPGAHLETGDDSISIRTN